MYNEFYGLKENPFNVTSDPNFLYLSRHHKEALSRLLYGINERKGFIAITGEIGTGKTTLCRALLKELNGKTKTSYTLNSGLPEAQLLENMILDFGLKPQRRTRLSLMQTLNTFLIEELTKGSNVVLIIDEAQNLKASSLEQIRMLSNLETEKEKLIQIVLVGQPQLKEKLESPRLEQLRQRISVRYHIVPFSQEEIPDYVSHRLNVAGGNSIVKFSNGVYELIYDYSKGIPRLINVVCDRALLLGFVMETKEITTDIVQKAVEEIEEVVCV